MIYHFCLSILNSFATFSSSCLDRRLICTLCLFYFEEKFFCKSFNPKNRKLMKFCSFQMSTLCSASFSRSLLANFCISTKFEKRRTTSAMQNQSFMIDNLISMCYEKAIFDCFSLDFLLNLSRQQHHKMDTFSLFAMVLGRSSRVFLVQ